MMRIVAVLLALMLGQNAAAQEAATPGTGAELRSLDRVGGGARDFSLQNGEAIKLGRLEVALTECRYPAGNPSGDAFAYLTVRDAATRQPLFSGWMVASAPALNALDHPRYDVWVLNCITS